MKILFFGTPDFAVPTLEQCASSFDVVYCVTQPDKPVGRSQVITPPPVKTKAIELGIPVAQPDLIKKNSEGRQELEEIIKKYSPDVAVVVAYGKIIPSGLLTMPKHGFVNVHGSLLPMLRGASPIQAAIAQGFQESGVTIMVMDKGMDTGPILSSKRILLDATETSGSLHDRLMNIGADLLVETLPRYITGDITPVPQDNKRATYCSLITKNDGEIDWNATPKEIDQHIRAFSSWPGAFTFCNNRRIKITAAHLDGEGKLSITRVKPEGKKEMPFEAFILGNPDCQLPPLQ
ncbi:MAG: methionyl-tRNA formyltransferase [Candidatus Kerfeldbacteria bacterium]